MRRGAERGKQCKTKKTNTSQRLIEKYENDKNKGQDKHNTEKEETNQQYNRSKKT